MPIKYPSVASEFVALRSYCRWLPDQNRRENWKEVVDRVINFLKTETRHADRIPNKVWTSIEEGMTSFNVMPSMRLVATAGTAAKKDNVCLYNCFGKETKFITSEGVKSFEDFKYGDEITVLTHEGNWKKAIVKDYGEQELQTIVFHRGKSKYSVRATKNHRWIKANKESTTNLNCGDSLLAASDIYSNFDFDSATPGEKIYWCYGYVYGNGTKVKYKNEYKYSMVRLCGKDAQSYQSRFEEVGFKTSTNLSLNGDIFVYTGSYLKTCPDITIDGIKLTRAFVDGYLSADGEKNNNWGKENRKYKSIQSSEEDHIEFIRKVFGSVGQYIIREEDLTGQVTNYGIRPKTIKFHINNSLITSDNMRFVVESLTYPAHKETNEKVWCLEVEDDHSFVLDFGLTTGNCSYLPINSIRSFSELLYILMCGTGAGFSVEQENIKYLPVVKHPTSQRRDDYIIEDSREGWAKAFQFGLETWFNGEDVRFDYSRLRPYGAPLKTMGGRSSGPEPLEALMEFSKDIILNAKGRKLTSLECHDVCCKVAEVVVVGGTRRSAMISFSDLEDELMRHAKDFPIPPHRFMANNSVAYKEKPDTITFLKEWSALAESGSGERGIINVSNLDSICKDRKFTKDMRFNPCSEIILRPYQMCNLSEAVIREDDDIGDLVEKVTTATWLGVIQGTFTHFPFLRPEWKKNCEEERLIGVSLTGQLDNHEILSEKILQQLKKVVIKVAKHASEILKVSVPKAYTCTKPSGTVSQVVDSSSGCHPRYSKFYIRRYRISSSDPLFHLMKDQGIDYKPEVGQTEDNATTMVVEFPIKAPDKAITTHNWSSMDQLNWYLKVQKNWSTHNVSNTVYVRRDEWIKIGAWVYDHFDEIVGISFLPINDHKYELAPYEEITEEKYERLIKKFPKLDFTVLGEYEKIAGDKTEVAKTYACSSKEGCDIK
jgi:ribonucleoside-diphosphate reductase alpha chain